MGITKQLNEMSFKRKAHVVLGAGALFLGVYGVYDEYINVIGFLKGASPLIFIAVGVVMLVAGLTKVVR